MSGCIRHLSFILFSSAWGGTSDCWMFNDACMRLQQLATRLLNYAMTNYLLALLSSNEAMVPYFSCEYTTHTRILITGLNQLSQLSFLLSSPPNLKILINAR